MILDHLGVENEVWTMLAADVASAAAEMGAKCPPMVLLTPSGPKLAPKGTPKWRVFLIILGSWELLFGTFWPEGAPEC